MSYSIAVFFKIGKVNQNKITSLVNELIKLNTHIKFSGINENLKTQLTVDITHLKNKDEYLKKFLQKEPFSAFNCTSNIEYNIFLVPYKDYKFLGKNDIYLGVSIPEQSLKFDDDPDSFDYKNPNMLSYEETKRITERSVNSFFHVLKIICETLKPEYGWGDHELNMQPRGFDAEDVSRRILIYGHDMAKKIGVDKLMTLPIKTKIKCSDGSYILLLEDVGKFNPELREKIKKHLFG